MNSYVPTPYTRAGSPSSVQNYSSDALIKISLYRYVCAADLLAKYCPIVTCYKQNCELILESIAVNEFQSGERGKTKTENTGSTVCRFVDNLYSS